MAQVELESQAATQTLISLMEAQGKEWQSAASLRSIASVAASEADVVLASLESVLNRTTAALNLGRNRATSAARNRAAEEALTLEYGTFRLALEQDVLAYEAELAAQLDAHIEAARAETELQLLDVAIEVDMGIAAAKAEVQ